MVASMFHNIKQYWWLWLLIAVCSIAAIYIGQQQYQQQRVVLNKIKARGEIVVVTRNAPTTYYETHTGQFAGFEYDMVMAFADYLGVKPRFIVKDTINEVLEALATGEADVAAAGLTITEQRNKTFIFGPSYQTVHQQVVCNSNIKPRPDSLAELGLHKLIVSSKTSYAERLWEVQADYPGLKWEQKTDWDTELLLLRVWQKKIDCTVADSNIFAINRRYYPEIAAAFPLTEERPLAWAMLKNAHQLRAEMHDWLTGFQSEGQLEVLLNRYYGHLDTFDFVDIKKFKKQIVKLLPRYRKWFKQAARKNKLDWRLLAAQSYQESHWNRLAKSPTGVRGIMMLTQPTAKQLGVKSRLDAKSNIFAGARYLVQLRQRLPNVIKEPDRTWMALTAYNMGYGHLTDAIELTKTLGKNPTHWIDIEEVIPLLSQRKYYKQTKHGYARGGEAVHYVKQIRDYRGILSEQVRKK